MSAEREKFEAMAACDIDEERLERAFVNAEINDKFFLEHQWELFERYPDQILLIHSGGTVEPFDDIHEMADRWRELDEPIRDAALTRQRQQGILIL